MEFIKMSSARARHASGTSSSVLCTTRMKTSSRSTKTLKGPQFLHTVLQVCPAACRRVWQYLRPAAPAKANKNREWMGLYTVFKTHELACNEIMMALRKLQRATTEKEILAARYYNPNVFFRHAFDFQLTMLSDVNKTMIAKAARNIDWYEDRVESDAVLFGTTAAAAPAGKNKAAGKKRGSTSCHQLPPAAGRGDPRRGRPSRGTAGATGAAHI